MNNRERWIIYPLLFCALGLAIRNQLGIPTDIVARDVQCRSLTIVSGDAATPLAWLGKDDRGMPALVMNGFADAGVPIASLPNEAPSESAAGSDDSGSDDSGQGTQERALPVVPHRLVELVATPDGGMLRLLGPDEMPALRLGHARSARVSGLMAEAPLGELVVESPKNPDAARLAGQVFRWPVRDSATASESADATDDSRDASSDGTQPASSAVAPETAPADPAVPDQDHPAANEPIEEAEEADATGQPSER